eukprot:gene46018-17799_t
MEAEVEAAGKPAVGALWAEVNRALLAHPNNAAAFYNDIARALRRPGVSVFHLPPNTAVLNRRVYGRMGITPCVRELHGGDRAKYGTGPSNLRADLEKNGAAQPSVDGDLRTPADGRWHRRVRQRIADHGPAGGKPLLVLHFIDTTTDGRIGEKKLCPLYEAALIRAGGLTRPAWKFGGLVPISADANTEDKRKAAQQLCHELWSAYHKCLSPTITKRLQGEAGHYVAEHRFIVDLEQNTPFTLQFFGSNVQE